MTTLMDVSDRVPESRPTADKRTARITGLWYLGLGLSGMLGFLLIRPRIYVAEDPAATLANLVDREALARIGLLLEVGVVATQALAAVWFYKLFRSLNQTAAWSLAVFGMANALAVLVSAVFMATALVVSADPTLAPGGDAAAVVQLMYALSTNSWAVGGLFFGLWLIPMGYVVVTTQVMSVWLGRVLVVGGFGYVLSTLAQLGLSDASTGLVELLVIPATIGELWMIAHLLVWGVRPNPVAAR